MKDLRNAAQRRKRRKQDEIFGFSFLAAACAVLLLLTVSCRKSSDWIQFRGEGGRGATSTGISPPLALKWKFRLQLDGRTLRAFNPPVVKDDTIYFGSADGNFYALDIESGYMRWAFKSGAPINSVPFVDDEQVYFGSQDGKAYAVSRRDGLENWSFRAGRPINSSVERYKDSVIFVSDGGAVFFLSPEGQKQFHVPNSTWYHYTFQMYDDVMYFAPGPGSHSFGPYDTRQQRHLWVLETSYLDAIWYSFPALRNDLLFFSTLGYDGFEWYLSFYAFDRLSGRRVWQYEDSSRWGDSYTPDLDQLLLRGMELLDFMAPSVWKDLVIYAGGDAVVRAFDADTGNVVWEKEFDTPVSSAPIVAGDRIYFGLLGDGELEFYEGQTGEAPARGSAPRLVCLSARDGRFLWDMELEGAILSAPVAAGKRLMFGTDKSVFYILEEVF
jgi:outer membrane protein assembly factor BamB